MAAWGSLQHIFETPLPESPTLLESLSPWNHHIEAMKAIDGSGSNFTELFGELHSDDQENSHGDDQSSSSTPHHPLSPRSSSLSSSLSSSPFSDVYSIERRDNRKSTPSRQTTKQYKDSDSFSCISSESFSLCTEGLGFESSDEVEDLMNDTSLGCRLQTEEKRSNITRHRRRESNSYSAEYKRSSISSSSSSSRGSYPPPISCIGRDGKPWVCFQSYRQDGRFILKEIRFPAQEFLHSSREDGRLKMQFIQSDDEMFEEDDDDDGDIEGNGDDDNEHEKNADEEEKEAEK